MNIVLCAVNAKYIHSNLAVYDLQAYAAKQGIRTVKKEYTINQQTEEIIRDLYLEKPDMIAFSCYIWNIDYVRIVAADLKKICPQVKVWLGGPEVSFECESFLRQHPWADGIMRGEGEETFAMLCRKMLDGEDPGDMAGITRRTAEGEILAGPDRPAMDLSEVPFPYASMDGLTHKIIYYESSRGCPFSCSYCLSSVDKCLRFRRLDLVLPELQYFLDLKVPQVKFVDRTFNCRKSHARTIWRYLLEHDNGVTNFHFEVSADLIEAEDLELMQQMRPGLIQLEIGVQSVNPDTIREIHRTMDLEKLKKNTAAVRGFANIHQHLDLIAGLPFEDLESFHRSFEEVYALAPDQLQLGFLKVLKGSYMYDHARAYDCLYRERAPYEVLSTRWLPYADVIRLKRVEEMTEVYYNSGQFARTLKFCIPFHKDAFTFFDELGLFYDRRGYLQISHTRIRRYEILQEYMEKLLRTEKEKEELKEWMIFDLYEREKMKTRPAWARPLASFKKESRTFYDHEAGTHALLPEYAGLDSRQLAGISHYEVFEHLGSRPAAVLFLYEQRDPLDHNARTLMLPAPQKNET